MFNEKPPRPLPYKYPTTGEWRLAKLEWVLNHHLTWEDVEDPFDRFEYIVFYLDPTDPTSLICPCCQTPLMAGSELFRRMPSDWLVEFCNYYGDKWFYTEEEKLDGYDPSELRHDDERLTSYWICPMIRHNHKTFVASLRRGDIGIALPFMYDECSIGIGGFQVEQ